MYEYANARIRGLIGRLMPDRQIEALAGLGNVGDLTGALTRTDYVQDLEACRESATGLALLEDALRQNLVRRIRALLSFWEPGGGSSPYQFVALILGRYDVANLATVFRAQASKLASRELEGALLPAGQLTLEMLSHLAELPGAPECLAQLRDWRIGFAMAISEHRRSLWDEEAPADVALQKAFWLWAVSLTTGGDGNARGMRALLNLDADISNVMAVIRAASEGTEIDPVRIMDNLLPAGTIPTRTVLQLLTFAGPERVRLLLSTPLGPALRALDPAGGVGPTQIETALEGYRLRWARGQLLQDPLGIGVVIAYHAAKVEEVRRLRQIGRRLASGWGSARGSRLRSASKALAA